MEDLNDIYFFASVVQHGGFSAAARRIGVEKTRLSRRIAALEKRSVSVCSSAPLVPWLSLKPDSASSSDVSRRSKEHRRPSIVWRNCVENLPDWSASAARHC